MPNSPQRSQLAGQTRTVRRHTRAERGAERSTPSELAEAPPASTSPNEVRVRVPKQPKKERAG